MKNFYFIAALASVLFAQGHGGCHEDPQPAHRAGVKKRPGKIFEIKDPMFGNMISANEVRDAVLQMVNRFPGFSKDTNFLPVDEKLKFAYLFFPKTIPHGKDRYHYNKGSSKRLDIEGDAGKDKEYVQIQLQIGTGQDPDHCVASVSVLKGVYYAPEHILYCLKKSYDTKEPKANPVTIHSDDPSFVSTKISAQSKKK